METLRSTSYDITFSLHKKCFPHHSQKLSSRENAFYPELLRQEAVMDTWVTRHVGLNVQTIDIHIVNVVDIFALSSSHWLNICWIEFTSFLVMT